MKLNTSRYNQHWNEKALSELGQFQRGKSKHRPRNDPALFSNGTYPLIQTGEIKQANLYLNSHAAAYNDFGLSQSKLWPKNTLCITIAANIAETALLAYPMCFPDSIVGFNADPEKSSELFMHYVFTYIRSAIQNAATGSIQDNINVEYLSSLKLQIPEKEYQDKIAAVLSALDAKIDCNQRINAQLEALAKTLYDYWFVQFDFPNAQGQPYRSAGGAMQHSSALGRGIPLGWGVGVLDAYAQISKGDLITAKTSKSGDIKVVAAGVDYSYLHAEANREKNTITVSGSGANAGFINFWREPIFASDCITVRGKTDAETLLVLQYLRQHQAYILSLATGSAQPHVYPNDIKRLMFIVPPPELVALFGEAVIPINEKIARNLAENQHLAQLRDWLLPLLMNGQVRVA